MIYVSPNNFVWLTHFTENKSTIGLNKFEFLSMQNMLLKLNSHLLYLEESLFHAICVERGVKDFLFFQNNFME